MGVMLTSFRTIARHTGHGFGPSSWRYRYRHGQQKRCPHEVATGLAGGTRQMWHINTFAGLAKDLQTVADPKVDQSCTGSETNSFDGSLVERLLTCKGKLLEITSVKSPWQARTSLVSTAQRDLP